MFKIVRGNSYYCHIIRGQFDQMSDMMKTRSSRSFEGNWSSYRGHLNISNVFASLQATWWLNFIKLLHRTPKVQGHIPIWPFLPYWFECVGVCISKPYGIYVPFGK